MSSPDAARVAQQLALALLEELDARNPGLAFAVANRLRVAAANVEDDAAAEAKAAERLLGKFTT